MEEAPPPPPSPLAGCYLLIVVGEPRSAEHRDAILGRVAKGFLSWDVESSHVDLEKELQALTSQAPEGEEARNGERLIQYATENLVTEVLIHPQVNTLLQCVRNLLSSFTRHRHLIHAGYTFAGTGSWVLQDGTFSLADFTDAFQETEVQRVLRAYEHSITIDVHCAPEGDWTSERMSREPFSRYCKVRINPDDRMTAGGAAIGNFINYLSAFVRAAPLEALLEPSDVVGNIRFSHPTLYVFPGGQGDAALFGINGFNMLVDGGFARKACFWDFVRHLDRLDAVLVTRLNNGNVNGMSAVLRRKQGGHVYPQIGHFFCNLQERKHAASPDGDKDRDPLLIDLTVEAHEMVLNLHHLALKPHACYSSSDPINLYHKVGHGKLDMYVLSPARDSRDLKEFLARWNATDTSKIFSSGGRKSSGSEFAFPLQNLVSICALLVWQPANPNDTITRILFPGSAPQHKIFEGIEKLRHLQFLRYPVCSAKSLSPSTSAVTISSRKQQLRSAAPAVIDKLLPGEVAKQQASPPSKPMDKAAPKSATIPVTGVEKPVQPVKTVPPSATPPTAAPAAAPPQVPAAKPTPPPPKPKPERLPAKTEPPKTKTELVKTADTEKLSAKVDKTSKTEVVRTKAEHKSKTETKTSTMKTRTETKSTRSTERKAQRTTITTSSVTEKKTDIKSSPTTPKKSVEHKVNGVAPKPEPVKHARPSSRTRPSPTSTPAKSAKEANNRKVVESKYHISKASKLTTTKAAKKEVQEPAVKAERKPVSRRPKAAPSSPAKMASKSPGSPAKSSSAKSTPTPSVKSEKDAVIRRKKAETGKITTDSSAVSTPSTAEVETVVKAKEKGVLQETPLVNGHVSEMIITKEEISKDHLDKPLEETYVEKKTEKIDSETIRKSPTDSKQEVTEIEDKISVHEKAIKEISTVEEKEKHVDEGIEEKESEVEEKETVVEDKETEIEEKEAELEGKESEIEEKESEIEEGEESRQLMHEKEDIEVTEEEQTEEIEDDEGPVDIKESLHAELETEVRKLMREKIEGEEGEEEEEEEEGVGGVDEEEEEEEDQEGEEDEEDEYLIVEKEDVESYQEQESIESHLPDDFDNKDIDVEEEDEGELQKHLLDEVETEKTKKEKEKEETFTKVEYEKEHLLKEKETDTPLKSKAEKETTETETMKEEHVEEVKGQDRDDVIQQTVKPLKEDITKDHIEEKVEEIISSAKEIVTKGKFEDERKPGVSQESDKDIQKEELSESKKEPETSEDIKEISSISPEEKIDISSEKVRETTDTDHKLDDGGHEMKDIPSKEIPEQKFIAEESQPDEKVSTTIESAATTAPTLPEDERIPLDEIKEIVEEKYVKEETKEKEKPVAEAVTRIEQPTTLPQVVMPIFETHIAHGIIHQRDIVKTPDEVADLPVHEEVDPGMYDADDFVRDFHKTKYEVQLLKKQQETEDMKDHILETGAKEERLKIDMGKADTLKESLKQFEDEKEVEEVKIVTEEKFIDETEDIKHTKTEIPDVAKTDVAKPSVKLESAAQLEELMSKEDMVKPTDDLKPATMISEEKLLEATFQTYTDLKATQEKVDELKEKFSEEAKKAIEKETDYTATSVKDIAHDKIVLDEMKEEKETKEIKKISAEEIPPEKKFVQEQLQTTSDDLKQKEKVISEDILPLQQPEVFEEKIKDETKPLPKDDTQEKIREEFITEDITAEIEKLEGEQVIPETKIEKEQREMVDETKQEVVTEDTTEEVKKLEEIEKAAEQEAVKKEAKDVEEVVLKTVVDGTKEGDEKVAVTEDISPEVKKMVEQEIILPKAVGEKESKTKDEVVFDETMKKKTEEETEKFVAEIKKEEDKEKPVPKEVTQEVILKDEETISEELIEEKKIAEKEKLIIEDDSEEFKKQREVEVVTKEVIEEATADKKEITKEMPEGQTKEQQFVKEDITEETKLLEDKENLTPKEVPEEKLKEDDKIIAKQIVQVDKKDKVVVSEDTLTTAPKLEERDKDLSKEVDDKEKPSQKEVGKDESKEEKVHLKELIEEEKKGTGTVTEDTIADTTKLEDEHKVAAEVVDESKPKDKKEKEEKETGIIEEIKKEMVDLKEQDKLFFKDVGKEKPKDEQEAMDKHVKELEVTEKLSPREVEDIEISKEEIPEKKTEKEDIAVADTIEETEKLREKEKLHPKEMMQDKAKEGEKIDSKEDKGEVITEDVTEKQEKEKASPKDEVEETTVKEEESVLTKAVEEDKSIKADKIVEIKKPQEMEKIVTKELVEDKKKESEEKKETITEDVIGGIVKPVQREKPALTETSEPKTKDDDTVVLKDEIGEGERDEKVIIEDKIKLEEKAKTPLEETLEITTKTEIITTTKVDEKKEEEKEKVVPDDIPLKAKELEEKEIVAKEIDESAVEEKYITSQKIDDEKIEKKDKVVAEQITEDIIKLDSKDILIAKEMGEEKHKEEERTISKMSEQEKLIEDTEKVVPEATEHVKKAEEKDICSSNEEAEEIVHEEWEIVSKEMIEEERKEDISKVVIEESTSGIMKPQEKEETDLQEMDEEKLKQPEETISKDTIVKKEEQKIITGDITEEVKKPEEKEIIVPQEILDEKAKEVDKMVPKDTVVKKEEQKVVSEGITEVVKKPEEREKPVPHEIPDEKDKEVEKMVPKDTVVKKEEEKVITDGTIEELKKTEEKEKPIPGEISEEQAKEAEKTVLKDTIDKKEEEKIITEAITEDVKKTEEKEKIVPHEIPDEKAKEAEKMVPKDTVVKKEEEKVITESITEELKKPEEKEKPVPHEISEEKAKEADKTVPEDTVEKKKEEKLITESITEVVKKPEEKEKPVPCEIPDEKDKEAEKTVPKDTVVKKEEEKLITEDITEAVKKPEEKEKPVPHEIPDEKDKEVEKTVPKDTVVKKEEEKLITEGITEVVKKPEDKEKPVPHVIPDEKDKEVEKIVPKDTVAKKEEEKLITEGIIEVVKKPEEKEKPVPHEIPDEKDKEAEKTVPKDTVVQKEEEKLITEAITEVVKKPEEKEKPVPCEIPDEKDKEAEKTVPKDTVVKKEEKKRITEDITEVAIKPEEKEKPVPHEIPSEKDKEAEKTIPKDTVVQKEKEKLITEAITEVVKKPEEKEKPVPCEIPDEKDKEVEKTVPKDTVVKKEEEKVLTECITEELKKPEEKEKPVPHEIPDEKDKEAEKTIPKDATDEKKEEKLITEAITEVVKKPEEKEKPVPCEIPDEKDKEAEKTVPKDTVVKKEEEKFITEAITEVAKKPEEKEKPVPCEIPDEKDKEAEKTVPKDTVVKKEEEKVLTEGITEELKKPEEKEKPVPHEIPDEKDKEAEKTLPKDAVVKKEEEKLIKEDITEVVKKPEEKEKPVPHAIPDEKDKEAEKTLPKDAVVKKEEIKHFEDVKEGIMFESKKPEEIEKAVEKEIIEEGIKAAKKIMLKDTLEEKKEDEFFDKEVAEKIKPLEKEKDKIEDEKLIADQTKQTEEKKKVDGDVTVTEGLIQEMKKEDKKIVSLDITDKQYEDEKELLTEDIKMKKKDIETDKLSGLEKLTEEAVSKEAPEKMEKGTVEVSKVSVVDLMKEKEEVELKDLLDQMKSGEKADIPDDAITEVKKKEGVEYEGLTMEKTEEKRKSEDKERTEAPVTEKIDSKIITGEVGMEVTTAKLVPMDLVEEKQEDSVISKDVVKEKTDLEIRKTLSTQGKISDMIETVVSSSDVSDIKADTGELTAVTVEKIIGKEVKPAEIIKSTDKIEKSAMGMHEETALKGEPDDKVGQKVESEKEAIKAPSALSATYLEIIDKLQKEEPSKIEQQEERESLKRDQPEVIEADKHMHKEQPKPIEKSDEISIKSQGDLKPKIKTETGVKEEKEVTKEYTTETEKVTKKSPTDSTTDKQPLQKEVSDYAVKEKKETSRKGEEHMLEEMSSLQEEKPITDKDKVEIGVEKEGKRVKVDSDSEETEKPSATVEWLTCVVKDTKPQLGEEEEEIFKKVVSVEKKKVSETVDQTDEKKMKEVKDEIEKAEQHKILPDSEISMELLASIDQKKQPEELIDVIKSEPKYDTSRPGEISSEAYLEDKKDELTKSISSEKEKQRTDEEKKQKTENIFSETESSIISKDLAETITTSVMKEYILKTTHITSDSVTSDQQPPRKMPILPSVEREIMPLQTEETGLSPKVKDTDKRAADTTKEFPVLHSHELKDTDKISAVQETEKVKQDVHEPISVSSTMMEKTDRKEETPSGMDFDKEKTVKSTPHMVQESSPVESELVISRETTVLTMKDISKEVKDDGITSKTTISATDHKSDDEDGEPPPSPGEDYIDSGMEEEPVYTKLDAPELPEYVTVTPDSTPASPKALPFKPQDDSAKLPLSESEDKEGKEKLKSEHTEVEKKEPAKVATTAIPQEKKEEYKMYVDEAYDKTTEPREVSTDKYGQTLITTKTEYKTVVRREGKPDEKAGSVFPVSSGEITTYTTIVKDDQLSDEEHLEEIDDDSKESVSEETYIDEDGRTVTRKMVRRYKTIVTSKTESAAEKGVTTEIPPSFSSGGGPGSDTHVSSGEITTYTTVVKDDKLSDEEHLEEIDDDSKESVSEETFTDENGRTVTRKIVRRYKTVVTSKTKVDDEKDELVTKEVQPPFLSEAGPTLPSSSTTTKTIEGHQYPLDADEQDDKAAVSEETFTDQDGRIVTRRFVRHHKTYVTHSTEDLEHTHIKADAGTPLESSKDIGERKTYTTVCTDEGSTEKVKESDEDDGKESVTEETFTDEEGRTVKRKVIRKYKTVITKETGVLDEKPTVKLVTTTATKKIESKESDDIDDGVEMEECIEVDDQDGKESVSEETYVDENGKTVTRRIVRRYKTVVTRVGESVDTKDSSQLAPKGVESVVDGTETGQTDLDDQDEKESVTEETFTDESGQTVTRKIIRRYKTVVTKESSSVSAEDSSQIRATEIISSELSPTVLTQKMYTTVIKSDDDRDDGVETDKLDEFDDQDEKESVSEETFTDENGRTVRRKIIRHYKTDIRQEGEPSDEKDSRTIKMDRISPELTSTATTSKSYTTVIKEGGDEVDGIEISDQDGKDSVTEETFTDENGRTVTRKIVRRYETMVTKESRSSEDKSTSKLGKDDIRDLEQTSTSITAETSSAALDDAERCEHTEFDDQDEKESVTEETFTDENGRTVTRKIVRHYKTVVTKESELPDERDISQLQKVLVSGTEMPTTTILRKIYTTVTKDGEGAEDGLETEQPYDLDDKDGKESITEETFTDENGRTVTRKIVKKYKTVVTTEGEDIRGDISSDGQKETDDDDSKDSVTEETFTDSEGRTVKRKIVKHYKTTVLKADDITDKVLSTKEMQFDLDKQEEKSTAFCSFTASESKSDSPTDITEGEDGKDSIIEETFTGEDGSVVTRKITRQYKTVLKKETGSDDHHFTTKISTGSDDPSMPLTTTTMTKTYTTVTKQGDEYSDDFLEELGKAHEPSGATSKTTTTVTTITKRISSKDGEEEITEATTEEVTSEDGKEQSTVTVTTKRDEHGDMVVHTSITPRDKEIDSYSISGPVSFISSDKKGEKSAHSTVCTTVTTSQTTTEAWKTDRKHDLQQCDSDEEDDPTSPLSITSQVAHSPPSHFGFEAAGSPTAAAELYSPKDTSSQKVISTQMTSSFYGSLPTGEEQLAFTDDKLDFQRALHEHREARGEDLPSAFHSFPQHKTVTMTYKEGLLHGEQILSGMNGQKHEDTDSKGASTKMVPSSSGVTATSQKIPPVVTSAHLPAESDRLTQKDTAGDKQKDPIGSWGKPLGLPAPAPPPANTITTNGEVNTATKPGTPKKEKKAMQMKKNLVMNENNKAANAQSAKESKSRRSESPVKQKNVSNKDVGKNTKVPGGHIYIDLTYVPHHGNSYYTNVEFFKKVRARYYVFSGTEPSRDVYNALLEAKQTWEDKDLEVTIIPTYDTDTLGYWVAENEDLLTKYKIDLSPSASRCTINLQDHETSCSAYRLEF